MIYTYVDCRITGIEEYAFTVTALKATKVIKQMNEYEFLEEIKPFTGRARLIRTWLIRSSTLFEVSVKCFAIISCLKCMVNSYFEENPCRRMTSN